MLPTQERRGQESNLQRFDPRSFSKRVALPRSREASPFAPPRRIELHSSGFQPDTLTISAKAARVRRRRFELLVFALKGQRAEPGCTNVASRGDRRDLRPLQLGSQPSGYLLRLRPPRAESTRIELVPRCPRTVLAILRDEPSFAYSPQCPRRESNPQPLPSQGNALSN